jgi:hypothetical protein
MGSYPELRIEHEIVGTEIASKRLLVDPLPTAELAGCAPGMAPVIKVLASTGGLDQDRVPPWITASTEVGLCETGQGGDMVVNAGV